MRLFFGALGPWFLGGDVEDIFPEDLMSMTLVPFITANLSVPLTSIDHPREARVSLL